MASVSVAIALWHKSTVSLLEKTSRKNKYRWIEWLSDEKDKLMKQLPLPHSFGQNINSHFDTLDRNADDWIWYHHKEIFWNKKNVYDLYCLVYCIVWHSNGAIDYYKSALKLIKSDLLTDLDKYRVACVYCLKEEVEKFWPNVDGNEQLCRRPLRKGFFQDYPLFDYWEYHCVGSLHSILPGGNLTINQYMIQHERVNNWPAIEYFFENLNVEDQVAAAIHFIDYNKHRYLRLMLMKLNESQRLRVYTDRAVQIIEKYVHYTGVEIHEANAISTWYEVRDLITYDEFASLLNKLCCQVKPMVSNAVLMEIWSSSSDDFKSHILYHPEYDFLTNVLRWAGRKHRYRDFFDFLFSVLTDCTKIRIEPWSQWSCERQGFFLRLCNQMLSRGELELVTRVLNLCFPCAEECAEIEEILSEEIFCGGENIINDGCEKLISTYEFQKLERFLNFFYSGNDDESRQSIRYILLRNLKYIDSNCLSFYLDGNVKELNDWLSPLPTSYPEIIIEYKVNLLFSQRGLLTCYRLFNSSTDTLAEIVADGLPDSRMAEEFGRRIIFSNEGISRLHYWIRDDKSSTKILRTNIKLFLKLKSDRKRLETELSSFLSCRELHYDRTAKKKYLQALSELF